jgi:hypothetical protein
MTPHRASLTLLPGAFAEFMKAEAEMYTDLVRVARIRIE